MNEEDAVEIISATEASRAFSEMLHRVCYGGESFIIKKGNRLMARITPVAPVMELETVAAGQAHSAPAVAMPAAAPAKATEAALAMLAAPAAQAPTRHEDAEYFRTVLEQLRKPMLADA